MEREPDSGACREAGEICARVRGEMAKRLVGKEEMVRGLLTGLVAGGHVLLEGVPGLAKTLAAKTFAEIAGLSFSRVQFTPDLLPADITGSLVYEKETGRFVPRRGPVFANVVLADEVNRAPAKVQSALLEAMEEAQVTIGDASLALPEPFLVLATQNPIEHEGTYPLPEAQLDRFLLKVRAGYPGREEEEAIVRRVGGGERPAVEAVLDARSIAFLRTALGTVRFDEALAAYAVGVVRATRPRAADNPSASRNAANPSRRAEPREDRGRDAQRASGDSDALPFPAARDVDRWVEYGASPRASIHLYRCARAAALLAGRAYVLPEDVKGAAPDVLRHRLVLSYEAEAEGIGADDVVARVLASLPLP